MSRGRAPMSMEMKAKGYFEVRAGGRLSVASTVAEGLSLLAGGAANIAPIDRLPEALARLFGHASSRHDTPYRVGATIGFNGLIATHEIAGVCFITWDHPGVVRGLEVLGVVDPRQVKQRVAEHRRVVRPERMRWPHLMMNAGNVRPWRPLPAEAERWLAVDKSRCEELIGAVTIHRLVGPKCVRWLVTFREETEVFGDHSNLGRLLRRMGDDDRDALSISALHHAAQAIENDPWGEILDQR